MYSPQGTRRKCSAGYTLWNRSVAETSVLRPLPNMEGPPVSTGTAPPTHRPLPQPLALDRGTQRPVKSAGMGQQAERAWTFSPRGWSGPHQGGRAPRHRGSETTWQGRSKGCLVKSFSCFKAQIKILFIFKKSYFLDFL